MFGHLEGLPESGKTLYSRQQYVKGLETSRSEKYTLGQAYTKGNSP